MVVRDQGPPFWRLPQFSARRPESGGWIVRVGWRWTAWALSYSRQDLSDAEVETILADNHAFGIDAFRFEGAILVARCSCGTEVVGSDPDALATAMLDHLAPLPEFDAAFWEGAQRRAQQLDQDRKDTP